MAIELKITGRCQGCPGLDIEIDTLYAGNKPVEVFSHCRNVELCQHIERHILENPYRGPDPREVEI